MRMSRASAYAIGALLQLAEAPSEVPIPCSHLAKSGEMPERFLLQVLRNLVNHGLLKSIRGVDGGYYLLRPADEISLLNVIEATDGPLAPVVPPLDGISDEASERLHTLLGDVTAKTRRQLSAVNLSALLSANSKPSMSNDNPGALLDTTAADPQRLSSL